MPTVSTTAQGLGGRQATRAQALARTLLRHDPRRLNHSAGAARAAAYAALSLRTVSADVVIAAAWLHDIGYAPDLVETGFHPVDGAAFLRDDGWDDQIVRLVAHHSFSRVTAAFYGADTALSRFAPVDGLICDVLTFADSVAGADGTGATMGERIDEIRQRPRGSTGVPEDVREYWYELVSASVVEVQHALGPGDPRRSRVHPPRS